MSCLDAYGVVLVVSVHIVFLCYGVENLAVFVFHAAVGVHEFVHHILRHDAVERQFLHDGVLDAVYALASDAYIHLFYFGFESILEFAYNVAQSLCGTFNIICYALAYVRGGVFFSDSKNRDAAIGVFPSGNSGHL